jgi:hypothetical protein
MSRIDSWNFNCTLQHRGKHMSNAALSFEQIGRDRWNAVLNAVTREYRGAHGRLEVIGSEVGYQVETENRPFDGIAADAKDGERIVWIHFGDLDHGVHGVNVIHMAPHMSDGGTVIEVEDDDGVKTILTLSAPEAFELPPAEERRRS